MGVDRLEWQKKAKQRARVRVDGGEHSAAVQDLPPPLDDLDQVLDYTGADGVARTVEIKDGVIVITDTKGDALQLYFDEQGKPRVRK